MSEYRLPDQVLFTDRDLGTRKFPGPLKKHGLNVEIHDDHFDDDTRDEVWLSFVGEQRWIALTRNKKIRYNPIELETVMRAGVPLFVMRGKWTHAELAKGFIINLPSIERFLSKNAPPFIANVYMPTKSQPRGRVKLWLSYEKWKLVRRQS